MKYFILITLLTLRLFAQCPPCSNQTTTFSVPLKEDSLPYTVQVELAHFMLPVGLQSFAVGRDGGKWLFISGRTNGLHNVDNRNPHVNAFPTSKQNTKIYVIDPETGSHYCRSLYDASSHLTQVEIDFLSSTNTLYYQPSGGHTLYIAGGYGMNSETKQMETKSLLAAIDLPRLIQWVKHSETVQHASDCIRFASHPLLQLTGGVMVQAHEGAPFLMAFGQNFSSIYLDRSNGEYSCQIRPFQIIDEEDLFLVQPYEQPQPQPDYRRRDLNVIPVMKKIGDSLYTSYAALSGVFTPYAIDNPGAWTVPININSDGSSQMLDPEDPNTLKQAMNNYNCANVGLYSQGANMMYTLLFGGISAAIFSDGSNCHQSSDPQQNCCTAWLPPSGDIFTPCCNLPFSNDITTISIDPEGIFRQYIMNEKFPTVAFTAPHCPGYTSPPNTHLWLGANAVFMPAESLPVYSNGIISLDHLTAPTCIGYIIGGIGSVVTDTNCPTDSEASPYVFKVTIFPK